MDYHQLHTPPNLGAGNFHLRIPISPSSPSLPSPARPELLRQSLGFLLTVTVEFTEVARAFTVGKPPDMLMMLNQHFSHPSLQLGQFNAGAVPLIEMLDEVR
jgi:hypothetical protein